MNADQQGFTRRTLMKVGAATVAAGAVLKAPSAEAAKRLDTLPVVTAKPADALVEMCGLRTNMWAANTSMYGRVDIVLNAIRDDSVGLGIRHIRERMILPATNQTMAHNQATSWPQIAALGVDVTCMIGAVDNSEGTVQAFADYIKTQYAGSSGFITAVENGNEPNAPSRTWNASPNVNGWVSLARTRQQKMASVFRNDPNLAGIKLAGPSLVGGAGPAKYQLLGDLSPNVDIGNFHLYAGTHNKSTPAAELDGTLAGVALNAPGKAIYCTETGMHNATNSTGMGYHPENVAGTYMPRVPLEHFYRGVSRTMTFELLDEHANPALDNLTDHFGLLRYSDSAMIPKPAYASFKRLLDLLRDKGPAFTPAGLSMQVTNTPTTYRQLLFQKRDGTFLLCMWLDVSIWDQVNDVKIVVPPVNVNLALHAPRTVTLYQPGVRTAPIATYNNTTALQVALAGEVCVLKLT